jgi:hypothetical protein
MQRCFGYLAAAGPVHNRSGFDHHPPTSIDGAWSNRILRDIEEVALDALVVRRRQVRMLGKWESWTLLLLWFEWKCSPVWQRWAVLCGEELRDGWLDCEAEQLDWSTSAVLRGDLAPRYELAAGRGGGSEQ